VVKISVTSITSNALLAICFLSPSTRGRLLLSRTEGGPADDVPMGNSVRLPLGNYVTPDLRNSVTLDPVKLGDYLIAHR